MKTAKHKPIAMSAVKSSSVSEAGYDPATKTLAVKFSNGGTYHYHGVSKEAFEQLQKAESYGKHFRSTILGKHKHIKL